MYLNHLNHLPMNWIGVESPMRRSSDDTPTTHLRGMIQCIQVPISPMFLSTWQFRDLLTIKQSPACTTVVDVDNGTILWQNAASMELEG